METSIAILRGINVGAHRRIKMDALKAMFAKLKLENTATYIQSGNLVFESKEKDYRKLEQQIKERIAKDFGFDVPVMVRQLAELKTVFDNNPFLRKGVEDIKPYHVTFLATEPEQATIDEIKKGDYAPDEFHIEGRAVYIYCQGSYHKTKLSNKFFEKKLKVEATTRNWKTVTKLLEIAEK